MLVQDPANAQSLAYIRNYTTNVEHKIEADLNFKLVTDRCRFIVSCGMFCVSCALYRGIEASQRLPDIGLVDPENDDMATIIAAYVSNAV